LWILKNLKNLKGKRLGLLLPALVDAVGGLLPDTDMQSRSMASDVQKHRSRPPLNPASSVVTLTQLASATSQLQTRHINRCLRVACDSRVDHSMRAVMAIAQVAKNLWGQRPTFATQAFENIRKRNSKKLARSQLKLPSRV